MRAAAGLLVLVAVLSGCGGDASGDLGDAELSSCASRWNSERAGATGAHAYADHGSREALVTTIEAEGAESCAVIFSVPEGSFEYGTLGEIATLRGWFPMQVYVPDAAALQRRGAAEANATVAPDGTVTLR